MPDYRRAYRPGGTFFFTLVTEGRAPIFSSETARHLLRRAIEECRSTRPFDPVALVLLPDHAHAMWTLPPNDSNYSIRWAAIKARFTHDWLEAGGSEQRRTGSRVHDRRRGVWQRRFWEHVIRDEDDYAHHLNYLHFNPVKHGLSQCPHAWPFSTFPKWVRRRMYEPTWQCVCDGRTPPRLEFEGLDESAIEMGE